MHPAAAAHTVHFYEDDARLAAVVARFAGEALRAGGAVLALATAPRLNGLERALDALGHDAAGLARAGKLVFADAEATLERFMVGELPDPDRFQAVMEPLLLRARAATAGGQLHAYGEMVNVLWERGNERATLRVEELWSELVEARSFSLLCAYRLGGFRGHEHGAAFREIGARHGAVLPSGRYAELGPDALLRRFADLEQRAAALEAEIERRSRAEAERARLHEAERAARAEIALLYRLADAANRAETIEQVYETALDGISSALGAERAAVLLFDSDGVMRFKAWRGLGDAYRAAVEGHSPWRPDDAAPAPVLSEDVRADPALAPFRAALDREGIGALGFFPLQSGGRLLGKFMVYHPRPHAFTEGERRMATAIADQVALAVDRKLSALERERLIGMVGHDLRNPLSAITMSAAALRRRADGGTARNVERIASSARRMERLISQLLEFAQARHGNGIPVRPRAADLAQIARAVVDELEAAHPGRRIAVAAEGDTGGEWDPDLLAEVLSNLVANAVQHGGGGLVTLRLRETEAEITAEVHNGGPEIPADVLPHLFDPFRRGRSPEGSRSQSVGLGLFISREIVRAHRGAIDVRSSAADGTTVSVRLPRTARR